ncbi:glutathionylspermidine synthase family protein [Arsenicicoccus sp. oral taxon 190]|uniref:glutathionylspermidine synthase family protein n=1 Tax=Arsenicicoccus sp. oral taxon 190 TaxID=1658671 RepID=UPI00067A20E5|nr:glutathionylspermidine synthase family protein [Arsenicicoccus sp. oral taxon 190]AKT52333.1 glutathionylspermidine synthase [Arsenicicoccus sp. oral taxon 190]
MRRLASHPREGWRRTVESQGLVYPVTVAADGTEKPYWWEEACYELTSAEVDHLEGATEQLHAMSLEAARFLVTGQMGSLGLPEGSLRLAAASLDAGTPSLYGRFDLRYDGTGPAKLLEYNADTPTGLLESAVVQWFWLQDVHPDRDQWNSVHERLIAAWQDMAPRITQPVWFAHSEHETSGEEWMTVTYLRDTCEQAGLATQGLTMGQIGYNEAAEYFVGHEAQMLRTCFALYPWEDMLREPFGRWVEPRPNPMFGTTWLEPPWKVVLSNKALLAALWHLYPGHELLLPAYLDDPGPLTEWVAKPLHGREGDNIRVQAAGVQLSQPGPYGGEGYCYQQWCPLPELDGNKAVLGCWVVDGHAAGLGIRESDGWITDYGARFVPHLIDTAAPSGAQREAWVAEDRRGR